MTTQQQQGVPVFWREHAFSNQIQTVIGAPGMSLAEIVDASSGRLPLGFHDHGIILVNEVVIPRESWRFVRPKMARPDGPPIVVNLMVPLQGGSLGRTLATVALVVVAVAAIAVSGGALGPAGIGLLGPAFGAGQLGAVALSAAIPVGGGLATGALA